METASTIIGLVCLALFIGPIYYFHRSGKKIKKQIVDDFIGRCREIGMEASEMEYWNQSILGIDLQRKKLLFLKQQGNTVQETLIDLRPISKCKVAKHYIEVKSKNGDYKVIDKLLLEFIGHNKANPVQIVFYDSGKGSQLINELQLVEKWAEIINNALK